MKKTLLALLFPIFSVNAGMLDDLKEIPASKYEVGEIQLELASYMLNEKLEGEKIKGTNFKINKFSVDEEPEKLIFKMSVIGRSKHLTEGACAQISNLMHKIIPKEEVMKKAWPALSEKQYRALDTEFVLKTELIAEENSEFTVSCY